MKKQATVTGKSIEAAVEAGARELGVTVNQVTYEILEQPKKGFLGFGATPAKVVVTYTEPARTPEPQKPAQAAPKPAPQTRPAAAPEKTETVVQPKQEKPQQPKSQPKPAAQKATPAPAPATPAASGKAEKELAEQSQPDLSPEEKAARAAQKAENRKAAEVIAVDFLKALLANMEITATVSVGCDDEGDTLLTIDGENVGVLIGHHGDTLDALQYLTNLAANRKEVDEDGERHGHGYTKITLDVENYRAKREETLRTLARRMAAKAIKYQHNITLEPMPPHERRIIHSEIQGIEGVSTNSIGTDNNRKIVIYLVDENGQPIVTENNERTERNDRGERSGNRRGGRGQSRGGRRPYYEKPADSAAEPAATETVAESSTGEDTISVPAENAPSRSSSGNRYNNRDGGRYGRRGDRRPRQSRPQAEEDDSNPTPIDPSQIIDKFSGVEPQPEPKPQAPAIPGMPKNKNAYRQKSSTIQRPYQKPVKKDSVESYYFDLENSETGLHREKEEPTDIAKICGIYEDEPDTNESENK